MVRLEEHKHKTESKPIERMPAPAKAYIPLSQHIGKICVPEVKAGDTVSIGQRIASAQAQVFAPVHSSISGKVIAIQQRPHPVLGRCGAVIIENDGKDTTNDERPLDLVRLHSPQVARGKRTTDDVFNSLTPEEIRSIVQEAGIVGMGGASFPTYIKLNPQKPIDTLIINGAECEPYLTGDSRLMVEKTDEILKGIELVKKCLGAKEVYIAIEENKPEAIKVLNYELRVTSYELRILKSEYPQGGEKQLIKNILNREVPSGKLPLDAGVVVHNVGTVFAIYEAVYLNKPLYERVVTVTGSCLSNPKNLLVRIGTPIRELIDFCGPLEEEPAKIIVGGPMMGIAQYTDEVPVIKSTTGIVLFNEEEARMREEESCIRCGACVRACPAGLLPCLINLASEKQIWAQAKAYNALDCIECGCCNYVCPANRNLVQSIKRAKLEVAR